MAALPQDTVFPELPPDLAIEVLSPSNRERRVLDKIGDYLQSGVRLVWVIDPESRTAAIYRSATKVREVDADGDLDDEDVLPGFRCALSDLFA